MLSYLQSGQEVACSPRLAPCWRNLAPRIKLTSSIPLARWCPDCARARSDIIPVLVFSHLATTYLDMERKRVYDPVMPSPPFISFIAPGQLDTNIYLTHTACTHTLALTHHIRVVPRYCTGGAPRFIGLSRTLHEFWDCDYYGVYILLT
jgi:hypothetical protein